MKIKINTNTLMKNINLATSTLDASNINPSLGGLLIEVTNESIVIICSNLCFSGKITIKNGFEIFKPGKVLVKGKAIFDIINRLNEKEVCLETLEDTVLRISTSSYNCDLHLLDTSSYPELSFDYDNWDKIVFPSSFFNSMSTKLVNCVAINNPNFVLNGVLLDSTRFDDTIESVATDGYHLLYSKIKCSIPNIKLIIDSSTLKFINPLLIDKDVVEFYIDGDSRVLFKIDDNLFVCKLIKGVYASVYKSLEGDYPNFFTITRSKLLEAINRGLVVAQSDKSSKINFLISPNKLTLSTKSIEFGSSVEELALVSDNLKIKSFFIFNVKYLLDILKTFNGSDITFRFLSENRPLIVVDESNKDYKALILPIKN